MRTLALVALAACGGAGTTTVAKPKLEAVDPETAEKGAKDLVEELYQDVGHGNTDSVQALLDPKLMVLGPRRGDAVANRADAILALGRYADAKKKLLPQLKSAALGVFPSEGGHSAWAFDNLDANGEHWTVIAVMSGTNDLWSLDGAMLGDTPPEPKLKAEHKKDAVVPPAAGVTIKADPAIAGIVEQFTTGLANQAAFGNDLELLIGPAAGEVARSKKEIKALWKKRGKAMVAGEVSGAATKDGMLAWVSAPIMRADEGEDAMPLRAFAVFRRSGATWKLVGLQESAALDAPGAGAPFKKFAPATAAPPPVEDKPAVKVVTDDKPTKKKKKKAKAVEEVATTPPPPADDEHPKKKKKKKGFGASDDDADSGVPTKKFGKQVDDEPAADDPPKVKKKKKKTVVDDPVADDDPPKKTKKKVVQDDPPADDHAPRNKAKKASQDDDDDAPKPKKKKKKKPVDDDDVKVEE